MDGGWEHNEGVPPQLAELVITDIAVVDEFAHPTRMRLLMLLREPATVAELAARLEVPTTRLYHHVARLEELGLVHVIETRKVRSVTEKRYRSTALGYRFDRDTATTLDPAALQRVVSSIFDIAKGELTRAVDGGLDLGGDITGTATVRLEHLRLTPTRRADLLRRLGALIEEFEDDDPDGTPFVTMLAAFPADG